VSSPLEVRVPDDSGPGSLRAAIDYANSQPGEDRITFKIGTGIQYILLRSALPGIKEKTIIDATTQPRDPSDNSNPLIPIPRIILYGAGVTEQDPRTDLDPVAVPPNPNRSGIYLAPGSDESEVRGLAIVYFNAVAEDFVPLPSAGIEIASASNTIAGNWSGIQPWSSSDATFVNFGYNNLGLYIHGAEATGNTIGEVGIADRNVISGNIGDGIRIEDGGGNQIINAYIGVDLLGSLITDTNQSLILANFGDGIKLSGSSNNIIGGTGAGSLNVISDNILPFKSFYETQYQDASGNGIHLTALELPNPGGQAVLKASTFNTIVNTYIGTDATGTLSSEFTANTGNGIFLEGASGTSIGGATAGGRVLVSGNFGNGIKLGTYVPFDQSLDPLLTTGTTIQNNFVGTDSSGLFTSTSLSNGLNGILLNGASGTTIGGTIALDTQGNRAGNVVSGNLLSGIRLEGNATGNTILGNMVGTTQSGNSDIGNGSSGIQLVDSGNNTIGGTTPGAGNAITGNNGNGILIAGNYAPGAGNLVQGNIIGASTATAQTGGNAFNGIQLVDTTNNTIGGSAIKGGTTLGAGNIITGNGFGSFSRTQLFTTGKSGAQNQGQFAKVAITDSFESIATGAFDGSLGYTAVINQQAISYPDGTTDSFGGPQVVLFTTDATGTSAVPNRLDLSFAVNQFIDPSSEIEIYSGNFLGTASQGRQDSVLITINGSGFSEGVHQAVLLKVIPDTYGLKLDINSAIVWNLDGVPTQVTAGHFLTGKADQFAIALTTSNGEVMVDLFNNKDSEIQRIGTITAPSSSNDWAIRWLTRSSRRMS